MNEARRENRLPEAEDAAADAMSARGLANAVPDPLIVTDANGVVLLVNEAAAHAFSSLAPGDLLALRFRSPEIHPFVQALLKGGPIPAPVDYVERLPIERVFRVSALPIGSGDKRYAILFRDHSEARRVDRMRADFIANASHELRTPLASIAGFVETLRGPARNDEKARDNFLQIMQQQTERMARLIDDLLSLSRLEMRPLAETAASVDLGRLLQTVTESLSRMAADAGVALHLAAPETPVIVHASPDELVQVFQNLIENACKYGHSGGRVDILIARDAARGEATVGVRDYGAGIAEEHIPRITERFYRIDVETSRAQKGTGLGLSIVKHIMARHKGRLSIKSAIGQGSTFTVHLPLAD